MIISRPQYKFIFIRIPKTASSSMKRVLLPYMQKGYSIRVRYRDIKSLKNLVCAKCMLGHYYKFTFVRNPFERIVSYYEFNKGVYKRNNKPWPYREFKEFVFEKGYWWQFRQHEWLVNKNGKPIVNFIGRFENIKEDWLKLCNNLGIEPKPLPVINKTKHRPYQEYYNNELRDFVTDVVKRDLELFDYVF